MPIQGIAVASVVSGLILATSNNIRIFESPSRKALRKKPRVTIHDTINKLSHNFMHSLANPFVRSISFAQLEIPYLLRLPCGIRLKIGGRKREKKRDDKEGKNERKDPILIAIYI